MAKMKQKDLESLKREDVKENNWEMPDNAEIPEKAAVKDDFGGVRFDAMKAIAKIEDYAGGESLLGLSVALIEIVKQKVDPEISANNPVWHWALADDHCTFVFRNGQKVRIEL